MKILRMADDAGAGGGTTDWRATLPADIKDHPSIKDFKDPGMLAKSWVNAQSLIGADKIAKPSANWKPEQWESYYNSIGRPATHDAYDFKNVKIPDGTKPDDAKMAATKQALHGAGLTQAQAEKVLGYYFGVIDAEGRAAATAETTSKETGMATLKGEYGDQFSAKMDIAKAVVTKFGSEELQTKLNDSKWGNDPHFIRLFIKMGEAMLDDSAKGQGSGLLITSATSAQAEINTLKTDKDFMSALTTREHPGHNAAVERWTAMHSAAYSGKK